MVRLMTIIALSIVCVSMTAAGDGTQRKKKPAKKAPKVLQAGLEKAKVRYEYFAVIDSSGDYGPTRTVLSYPVLEHLTDTSLQRRVNEYFRELELGEGEIVPTAGLSLVHLTSSTTEGEKYLSSLSVTFLKGSLVSFHKSACLPGGNHPIRYTYSRTIDARTLRPISLNAMLDAGYKEIVARKVRDDMNIDDEGGCFGSRIVDMWRGFVDTLRSSYDVGFTPAGLVLERDTEFDFGCSYVGKRALAISVPFDALAPYIRSDGPLADLRPVGPHKPRRK